MKNIGPGSIEITGLKLEWISGYVTKDKKSPGTGLFDSLNGLKIV
jgi:hypothetical protein